MPTEDTESSTLEEASSIHSEDLWVNPKSLEKENPSVSEELEEGSEFTTVEETDESSEYEESSEYSDSTQSSGSEENESEESTMEDNQRKQKTKLPEAKKDLSESEGPKTPKNFSYLYKLMNEEVPEDVLRRESVTEENVPTTVELTCPKCDMEYMSDLSVKFQPCKHKYCINCVLNSHGTYAEAPLYQCPVVSCASTLPTSVLEVMFPNHIASYRKYQNIRNEAQETNILEKVENEENNSLSKKEKKEAKKQEKREKKEISAHNNITFNEGNGIEDLLESKKESSEKDIDVQEVGTRKRKRKLSFGKRISSKGSMSNHSSNSSLKGSIRLKKLVPKKSNSNKRLRNVLSVGCPRCSVPVSADPNEDIVICPDCDHGFCFACLQTLEIGSPSTEKHRCVSSNDIDCDSDSEESNTKSRKRKKPKRTLSQRFKAFFPPMRNIIRRK